MSNAPIAKNTTYRMTLYNDKGEAQPTPKGKSPTCTHQQLVSLLANHSKAEHVLNDLWMWGNATIPASNGELRIEMVTGTHFAGV